MSGSVLSTLDIILLNVSSCCYSQHFPLAVYWVLTPAGENYNSIPLLTPWSGDSGKVHLPDLTALMSDTSHAPRATHTPAQLAMNLGIPKSSSGLRIHWND